jgi:nitronate monooxygenase
MAITTRLVGALVDRAAPGAGLLVVRADPAAGRAGSAGRRILVSAQANGPQAAVAAGVDLIEAQGTEAGGHTGTVATLPLLQRLRQDIDVPMVAAGGIGTPEALAAVLVAGAEDARVGTCLLLSQEAVIAQAA